MPVSHRPGSSLRPCTAPVIIYLFPRANNQFGGARLTAEGRLNALRPPGPPRDSRMHRRAPAARRPSAPVIAVLPSLLTHVRVRAATNAIQIFPDLRSGSQIRYDRCRANVLQALSHPYPGMSTMYVLYVLIDVQFLR